MKIFVDIGAHYGETLHVALDPKWGFDRVFSLEPASACQATLRRFRDPRLSVEQIALSDHDGMAVLHGAGLLGGSLYANKTQKISSVSELATETVPLVRATRWFRQLPEAEIFLKFNCEGGEADILDDLLSSGEIQRVASAYIDFDIRKVPGQAHRQLDIERRLREAGVRYVTTDEMGSLNDRRVSTWLNRDCATVETLLPTRLQHALLFYAPPYERLIKIIGLLLPNKLYWWLGRRFGRLARTTS